MNALSAQQDEAKKHLQDWCVGAVFMEAGTGKTRVALELARMHKGVDLILWIAPLRTIRANRDGVHTVKDEIEKWGGFYCPVLYVGIESLSQSDRIYLETFSAIKKARCPMIIVDESLKVKNAGAKRTERVIEMGKSVKYKIILNGTPFSRTIEDLWAQFEFLSPKILNMSATRFKNTFLDYTEIYRATGRGHVKVGEKIHGYENVDYLYSLLRHYVYECDLNLNVRQYYRELDYTISEEDKEEYDKIKEKFLNIEELIKWNNNIFLAMTQKLQQSYCCSESKFNVVKNIIKSVGDPSRVIIFCKYVKSQEECRKRFPDALVLSYQKESLGLNLQQYNHTIYFDKTWDYALREQSGRRSYRTGQEYDCYYYDLNATNAGLDRMIGACMERKVDLITYFKGLTEKERKKQL